MSGIAILLDFRDHMNNELFYWDSQFDAEFILKRTNRLSEFKSFN